MNKATKGNTPRGSRMSVNESALKKIAKAKKLKKKLNEKRKQQEAATSDTQPNTTTSE
jgi:hypothetical protein